MRSRNNASAAGRLLAFSSFPGRRRPLLDAPRALFEGLERRQLLTGTAFGISGPASAPEGSAYVLSLSGSGPGVSTVDHWTIDWGDGTAPQTVAGFPSSVSHAYADGPASQTITATVTNADGTFAARNGAAVDDAGLDLGFDLDGKLVLPGINLTASAVQSDGKLLVAGEHYAGSTSTWNNFWVGRFNVDGTPDMTFGTTGSTTIDIDGRLDEATSIVVQPDGKIVLGGKSENTVFTQTEFALIRLNADGSLDNNGTGDSTPGDGFGTGGKVLKRVGSNSRSHLTALALQPDGKIVAAGYTEVQSLGRSTFALARFNPDGTSDAGFGSGGAVATSFPDANDLDKGFGVAIQSDGKIVVAGESVPGSDSSIGVARYTASGALDTTFDGDGLMVSGTAFVGMAYDVAIDSAGRYVLGGKKIVGSGSDWALARIDATGAFDTTFGTNGVVHTPIDLTGNNVSVRDLSLLPDGRILAAGTTITTATGVDFSLARYNADGTLDATFGAGGKTTTDFDTLSNWPGNAYKGAGGGMAVGADGSIVLAGGHSNTGYVARYNGMPPAKVAAVTNVAPTLSISGANTAVEGTDYTLALARTDAGADTLAQWTINWGDGTTSTAPGGAASAVHRYADNGSYTITATATDEDGTYAAAAKSVQFSNVAPMLNVGGGRNQFVGSPYTLTLSSTDRGADAILSWTINWGDNTQSTVAGSATSAQHQYAATGDRTITVSAADEDGAYPAVTSAISLWDFNTSGTANLALGKPTAASTVHANMTDTYGHRFAVDGLPNTRWASHPETGNVAWLSVDLGSTHDIERVRIRWELAFASSYQIEVSDDNVNWAPAHTNTSNAALVNDVAVSARGRYVRINCLTAGNGYAWYSIWDLEVFGGRNVAQGQPVAASSTHADSDALYGPGNVTDGVGGTRWASKRETGNVSWLYTDLGFGYDISRVRIRWEGSYASSFKIQVSDDGASWTDAYSTTSNSFPPNSSASQLISDVAVSARGRCVRVLCEASTVNTLYSIYELEVFGSLSIAMNRPTAASSVANSTTGHALVNNGFFGDRWASAPGATAWVSTDLGSVRDINRVRVGWDAAAYASSFKIRVSDNNVNWTDVYTTTTNSFPASNSPSRINDVPLAVRGRYVRIEALASTVANYYSIRDMEVFGGTSLALNRQTVASSVYENMVSTYGNTFATDGAAGTRWASDREPGAVSWIYTDLGESTDISRVRINWEHSRGTGFRIQVSDDAANWSDAYATTDNTELLTDVTTLARGRYVRILCETSNYNTLYSLFDFQVFGKSVRA
jgi:uncharacterized delta-60 repeat protein